jgi:hypothetical protein
MLLQDTIFFKILQKFEKKLEKKRTLSWQLQENEICDSSGIPVKKSCSSKSCGAHVLGLREKISDNRFICIFLEGKRREKRENRNEERKEKERQKIIEKSGKRGKRRGREEEKA